MNRVEAYQQFLKVLGITPDKEAPAHRIAFNVAWYAGQATKEAR